MFSRRQNISDTIKICIQIPGLYQVLLKTLKQRSVHKCFSSTIVSKISSRLSPQEVNVILQANEQTLDFPSGQYPIKSCDTNQLASNQPIEDTRSEAFFHPKNGFLFGVFDGHGGGACAQVLSKRLFHYIARSLQDKRNLATLKNETGLDVFNERFEFVDVLRDLYSDSLRRYSASIANDESNHPVVAMQKAFVALDNDISREAIETESSVRLNLKTLSVAMSGAVSAVAYVCEKDLYVASVGDCQAVLGVLSDGHWAPKTLCTQHNSDNYSEVERILLEHPANERDSIIKFDRLFGQLAPLRAFGDFRYKWPLNVLKKLVTPHYGDSAIPPGYLTPPYLSAKPDVSHHRLTSKDKFLILATDGLWDFITPLQAVRLVGEHMRGKTVLTPFQLPHPNVSLGEVNEALLVRKDCLTMKPIDQNASTHLIRNALCATEYGLDQGRLAHLLALPPDVSRNFRDDMTVTVVYFESEFLRRSMLKET